MRCEEFKMERTGLLEVGDVLLVCHNYEHQQQVYQGVLEAVKTNKLTTAAIDAAAVRIVENKMIKLLDAGKQQELLQDLQKEAQ